MTRVGTIGFVLRDPRLPDVFAAAITAVCVAEIDHPNHSYYPAYFQSRRALRQRVAAAWKRRGFPAAFLPLIEDMMDPAATRRPTAKVALARLDEMREKEEGGMV